MSFGAETTTDEVLEGIDLTGRVAVVTGGYGGLGRETARALAAHGARVVIAGRDPQRLADTAAELTAASPAGTPAIETLVLDLASLDSVRAAAAEVVRRHPAIHLLIDNAGVMACPPARTADGFEMQFGTNHLGHFLFTLSLLDALREGAPSRVVVLSSAGHRVSPIRWDDLDFDDGEYHNWTAYGQSKTANALFALELDRRLGAEGVHAYSVHPGVIMTELGRHMGPADFEWMAERARRRNADTEPSADAAPFTFKSVEAGAATSVWAATAPELEAHGGAYLEDCQVAEVVDGDDAATGVAPWAADPVQAARLWELSEELVGGVAAL
jgi:NAD(P)-dependent dehydrogenase (short-subunit alcohol dehydrogenase family)